MRSFQLPTAARLAQNCLDESLKASLAEAVNHGLTIYDDLADEVYTLEEKLRAHQSVAEFLSRCRGRGLSTAALELKLAARAEARAEAILDGGR